MNIMSEGIIAFNTCQFATVYFLISGKCPRKEVNIPGCEADTGPLFSLIIRGRFAFFALPSLFWRQRLSKLAGAASSLLANANATCCCCRRDLPEHLATIRPPTSPEGPIQSPSIPGSEAPAGLAAEL